MVDILGAAAADGMNTELSSADQNLVNNSALLATILSASNDCIKILDLDGNLLFMSEGGKRVMEVDDFDRFKNCPWPDFWQDEGHAVAKDAVLKARDGQRARFLGKAATARGNQKFWDVQVLPIMGEDGRPGHLLSISRDISDVKLADATVERLVREAQTASAVEVENLRQLFKNAPSFMCVLRGPDHTFEMTNEAYLAVVGRRDIIGKSARRAFPEWSHQGFHDLLDDVFASGRPYTGRHVPFLFQPEDGGDPQTSYLNFVYQPILGASGEVSGIFIEGSDVTDQIRAETARVERELELRESEAKFRAIADTMPQMVWSTRPDGHHDYYNARWYAFTGVPAGTTDGEGWNGLFHPDDQEAAWERWRHSLATGDTYEIEYRLRHHTGLYRWTLGRALPIRDDAGQITRWFGTCTDIHDSKEQAEYTTLLSHELSHRIKNIFAIIHSLIGLSARRAPESKKFALDLQERLSALGRAHDFARPHSEISKPVAGETTLHAILREILRPYPAMDEGRLVVTGDDIAIDDRSATPLALIFHELATNASKYGALSSADGLVTISSQSDAGRLSITWVEMGGPPVEGIPERTGFGTRLSGVSVENHLAGKITRHWLATGLVVEMTCPETSLRRA